MGEIEINYACSFTVENFGWDGQRSWVVYRIAIAGPSYPEAAPHTPDFLFGWMDHPHFLPEQGGRKETFYRSRVRLTIGRFKF